MSIRNEQREAFIAHDRLPRGRETLESVDRVARVASLISVRLSPRGDCDLFLLGGVE